MTNDIAEAELQRRLHLRATLMPREYGSQATAYRWRARLPGKFRIVRCVFGVPAARSCDAPWYLTTWRLQRCK